MEIWGQQYTAHCVLLQMTNTIFIEDIEADTIKKKGKYRAFTYFLSHLVQICFGSTHDDHIHSLLSQLREATVDGKRNDKK